MKPRAFPGFPANRENSNCPNFSLRQIRNIVCCIVADFSFDFPFFFFNFNIFSDRQKEKKKWRTNALSSSLPKSYFPPPCIYSPKESVWRRCSLPLYACRVIKDSSWKNSKVEEYRIAKYKYFLSMLPLGERSQLFPIRFALR